MKALEEERERLVRSLEAKIQLMASQLEEKEQQLQEAKKATKAKEVRCIQLKGLCESMCVESNRHWQVRWNMREKEAAAKEEKYQQQVAQVSAELKAFQEALKTQPEVKASQLEEKDRQLKQALKEKDSKEQRCLQLKAMCDQCARTATSAGRSAGG